MSAVQRKKYPLSLNWFKKKEKRGAFHCAALKHLLAYFPPSTPPIGQLCFVCILTGPGVTPRKGEKLLLGEKDSFYNISVCWCAIAFFFQSKKGTVTPKVEKHCSNEPKDCSDLQIRQISPLFTARLL